MIRNLRLAEITLSTPAALGAVGQDFTSRRVSKEVRSGPPYRLAMRVIRAPFDGHTVILKVTDY